MAGELKLQLDRILADLRVELASLRTGRATPALVEDLEVEVYGRYQPLKALAAISVPESRSLLIQPWDKSVLPAIEKAVQTAPLGLNPIADKDAIRLVLPIMTEERKKDLVKSLKEKLEHARIRVRQVRDEAKKAIDVEEKAKKISEDEKFRRRQEVEKVVGQENKKLDELGKRKEAEIMTG